MKKHGKLTALLLTAVMLCGLLSGCVYMVGSTVFAPDGSGTMQFVAGFTQEALIQLQAFGAELDISELTPRDIDGVTYFVMDTGEVPFSGPEEFTEAFTPGLDSAEDSPLAEALGSTQDFSLVLEAGEDGALTLRAVFTIPEPTAEEPEAEEPADGELDAMYGFDPGMMDEEMMAAMMQELLEGILFRLDFTFPGEVTQTAGDSAGITVDGCTVSMDIISVSMAVAEWAPGTYEYTFVSAPAGHKAEPAEPGQAAEEPAQAEPAAALRFRDVTEANWYYTAVTKMTEMGLFKGTEEADADGVGAFSPAKTMTRAEFLTVLMRYVFADEMAEAEAAGGSPWYSAAWTVAERNGILTAEEFALDGMTEPCTREEMSLLLIRACEESLGMIIEITEEESRIADWDSIGGAFRPYVLKAYSLGLLTGVDDAGTFDPAGELTRAQGASVLYRLVNA